MLSGLLLTRIFGRFGLPDITSYLVAGLLIGPYMLGRTGVGFTGEASIDRLQIISDVALGFIAFAIGNEFRLADLKKTGRQAAIVAVAQALAATILVDAVLLGLYFAFDLGSSIGPATCICLGAIATATAPAATMMVVNQYKAKGPLTDILLPIVALDDAVGLIVFAVSFGIAKTIHFGSALNIITVLVNPLIEVFGSLLVGAVMGWAFSMIEKLFHSNSNRMSVSICFVFLTLAISMVEIEVPGSDVKIGFSYLLVCMMLGTIFCNLSEFSEDIMERVKRWTAPLYVLFFVISGAELNITVFKDGTVVLVGILYILARSAGKYLGARWSAQATKCPSTTCKYLGITLLPQAGVALGMSVTVAAGLENEGAIIRNIVLFAVLIYELVGPVLTKKALTAAGEISAKPEKSTAA